MKQAIQIAADFTRESIVCTRQDAENPWYGVNFEQAIPYLLKKLGKWGSFYIRREERRVKSEECWAGTPAPDFNVLRSNATLIQHQNSKLYKCKA